jgi:hypothetical protein
LFGGGGAAVGTGLLVKAATAVTVGALVGGAGYEGVHRAVERHHSATPKPAATKRRVSTPAVAHTPIPAHAPPSAALTHKPSQRHASPSAHPQKPHLTYHGDASVAARHVHVRPHTPRPTHPTRPAHPSHPTHPAVSHRPAVRHTHPKPVKKTLPGPFDASPSAGGGHGHGK